MSAAEKALAEMEEARIRWREAAEKVARYGRLGGELDEILGALWRMQADIEVIEERACKRAGRALDRAAINHLLRQTQQPGGSLPT